VRASLPLAGLGGLLLGATLLLSYGMVLLAPIVLTVVVLLAGWRGAWRPLAAGAVAVAAVLAGFAVAGFWWLEGLELTAERVRLGEGWSDRPTWFFLLSNPAALAVAVGPAVVAALPRVRRSPVAVAALAAMAVATASNLSKGEVERIWLPYAVWLVALPALLPSSRGWLAAHLGWPVVVAAGTSLSW
jgi:hypothetical protein